MSSCASEEGVVSAQLKAVVMLQLSKMSIIWYGYHVGVSVYLNNNK